MDLGSPSSSSSLPLSLSGQKLSRRQSWRADEISASRELQVGPLQNPLLCPTQLLKQQPHLLP